MKSVIKQLLVVTAVSPLLGASLFAEIKGIYGADDRLDYFQAPEEIQQLADSVVSLWRAGDLVRSGSGFNLITTDFGASRNLCPTERFREQPVGAFCSGTLVGEDLIMTAGHCIENQAACENTKFVFGFAVENDDGIAPSAIPAENVYSCKRMVGRSGRGTDFSEVIASIVNPIPDYALILLDRKAEGRRPLPINRTAHQLRRGDPVFIIGHPSGLPVKIAGNAKVRTTFLRHYFSTDLDAFGGNSGSAVFNARTKLIEGILVGGSGDFETSPGGCRVSIHRRQNGGFGEFVTKISSLAGRIPPIPAAGGEVPVRSMSPDTVPGPEDGISERMTLSFE